MYLKSQGFKNKEIETIVGMSHGTVTNHLKLYHQGGLEALKTLNYKGQPSQLHRDTEQIKASFETHPVGTLKEVKARIKDLTAIELSLPQIQYFFRPHWAQTTQGETNSGSTRHRTTRDLQEKKLEPLIEQASNQEIHILFMDAAHFVLRPFLGFLYCITTLFVNASAGRKRYNVLGALNAITKELTVFTNFTYINSFSICALLDQLKAHYTDGFPVYVILDNARYQKNRFVQAYAEQLGIILVYLPAYSPNLNLIERLWKFVKKNVLYSVYYADFSAFTAVINQCLTDTQDTSKEELSTLLTLNFQTFKDAKIKP